MEYKLTEKVSLNKRGKDGKSRSYLTYFLNGVEILKQKLPYEEDYEYGFQHRTGIDNVYLLNGKINQIRTKFDKSRIVKFPVSKNKLVGVPNDFKIELSV
jgi:hypothetical protein